MRVFTLLTLCLLCVSSVHGKFGADGSVCDQGAYAIRASKDPGPKKPNLPLRWNVRIEGNILRQNFTQDIHEYYDGINNRGAVVEYVGGVRTQVISLYSTNELITLQFDNSGNPPRCHVDDLAKSTARNVFGLIQWKNGSEHIFSANQALHFGGNIPEVYIGRAYARGIFEDVWESCNYWDALDATFHLVWYFSANGSWTPAVGFNQVVPVQFFIDGVVHVNGTSQPVNRLYAFTDFQFDTPTDVFETPPMTFCEHRVSLRSPPNISRSFSFSAEVITPNTFFVDFIDEYYDSTHKLARFDLSVDASPPGHKKMMTRVLDYNTGIVYNVDSTSGTCAVSAIDGESLAAIQLASSGFRMQTSAEFMYMNNMTRTYTGQRTVRGITCDVFAGRRSDYPPGSGKNTLWEWYYASSKWMENTGDLLQSNQLIMLQISSGSSTADIIYNVYDYTEEQQNIWETDVTACFNSTQRELVTVAFPGSAKDNVIDDVDGLKYAVVTSASNLAQIAPLRISELQVDLSGQNIDVSFYVLDSPTLPVNVKVTSPVISLADAVSKLRKIIHEGAFVVVLPNFVPLYAIKS